MSYPNNPTNIPGKEDTGKTSKRDSLTGSHCPPSHDATNVDREFMDSVKTWMKNHDEILEKTITKMNETSSRLEKLEERVNGGFDKCDRRANNQERAERKASLVERRLQDHIIKLEAMEREVEENHDWTKDSISELQEHYHASAAANNGNDY